MVKNEATNTNIKHTNKLDVITEKARIKKYESTIISIAIRYCVNLKEVI